METGRAAAALLTVFPALAWAAAPAIPPGPPGAPIDAYGQAPRATLAYAAPKLKPVCNNGNTPNNIAGTGTPGQQAMSRIVVYCPRGAQSIVLTMPGFYTVPAELSPSDPVAMQLSVEVSVPAPWSAAASYAVGATATYNPVANQTNPVWTAIAANTNSAPTPGNTNWTAGPAPTLLPVTCGGSTTCFLGVNQSPVAGVFTSAASASGTTLTFASGALPATVAVGQSVYDTTGAGRVAAGTTITAVSSTTVTLSTAVTGSGVASGDAIQFYSFPAQTQAYLQTDAVPVNCPVGCFLALREYIVQSGAQVFPNGGTSQQYSLGDAFASGATTPNTTTTAASYIFPTGAGNPFPGPVMVTGIPQADGPTAVVIGDSRSLGAVGRGISTFGLAISSGGSGYTQADVGKIVSYPNTGSPATTSGCCDAFEPAQLIILQVNGGSGTGAVTSFRLYKQGHYNNTSNNTVPVMPSGTQVLVGGGTVGSGFSVTGTNLSSGAVEFGDYYGAAGMIGRGLSEGGVAYANFSSGGDSLTLWAQRDYMRQQLIAKSGATTAIVQLGINDVTGGRTLAQMQADAATLIGKLNADGIRYVYFATVPPVANSTDGYTTIGGETLNSTNGTRVAWNDYIRTLPLGIAGVFETANTIEANSAGVLAQDGGYVLPNASPCYYLCDGTHFGQNGYAALSAAVLSRIGTLH